VETPNGLKSRKAKILDRDFDSIKIEQGLGVAQPFLHS
jgi:hypothetical protein